MLDVIRQPFFVAHMKEAETLDDLDTPVIVYMSPSMCELLGYDMVRAAVLPHRTKWTADPAAIGVAGGGTDDSWSCMALA